MPLPSPKKGEEKSKFVSRCRSNPTMKKEFPDEDQRLAVCYDIWDDDKEALKRIEDGVTLKQWGSLMSRQDKIWEED